MLVANASSSSFVSEVDMCQPVAVQSASVADQIHMPQLQLLWQCIFCSGLWSVNAVSFWSQCVDCWCVRINSQSACHCSNIKHRHWEWCSSSCVYAAVSAVTVSWWISTECHRTVSHIHTEVTQSNGNLVVDCDTATETTTGMATTSTPRPVSANTNSLKKRKILQDCSLNFSPDLSSGLDLVRLKQYQQRMPDVMHMDDIHQDAVELAELLMATFANKRHLILPCAYFESVHENCYRASAWPITGHVAWRCAAASPVACSQAAGHVGLLW